MFEERGKPEYPEKTLSEQGRPLNQCNGRPCSERVFSGYSGFPLSSNTNISKFQFDLEFEGHRFVSHTVKCHPH